MVFLTCGFVLIGLYIFSKIFPGITSSTDSRDEKLNELNTKLDNLLLTPEERKQKKEQREAYDLKLIINQYFKSGGPLDSLTKLSYGIRTDSNSIFITFFYFKKNSQVPQDIPSDSIKNLQANLQTLFFKEILVSVKELPCPIKEGL